MQKAKAMHCRKRGREAMGRVWGGEAVTEKGNERERKERERE